MENIIKGQKVDAVRITCREDIPKFLRHAVIPWGNKLILQGNIGAEEVPINSIIGYEKFRRTASGWNLWRIEDTDIIEIDGVFYEKATPST